MYYRVSTCMERVFLTENVIQLYFSVLNQDEHTTNNKPVALQLNLVHLTRKVIRSLLLPMRVLKFPN